MKHETTDVTKKNLPTLKIAVGIGLVFLLLIYPGWLRGIIEKNEVLKTQAALSVVIDNGSKKIPEYGSSGHYLKVPRIKD